MAGPWEQFAPASAPAAAGPWTQFATPDQADVPYPAVQPSAPAALATATPAKTGVAANAAAGAVEGGAGILNVLSEPIGNLVGKPIGIIATTAHDVLAPVFGYDKFTPEQRAFLLSDQVPQVGTAVADAAGRALNAPRVEDVQPAGLGESAVRAGVRGGVGLLGLNMAAAAPTAVNALGSLALGGSGGGVGDVARQLVPAEYAPVAELGGNVLGAALPGGAWGLARGGVNAVADYAAPAIGRRNALLDGVAPIPAANGTPIVASVNQARMAADRLQAAATDPAAVRSVLDNPPAPLVPGAEPTTFQLTRDPGLGQLERGVARATPEASADFKTRADTQNDARVGVVRGVADGADPATVPQTLHRAAADIDAAASARVQQVQQQTDAQLAQAQAAERARVAALQQGVGQAVDAIGGNLPAGSESQVGAALRAPIDANLRATRTQESALWNAIDPDGKLAVDMMPVRARAQQIAQSIGPNAAPLAGDEAAIMRTATNLPDVQGFRDLADLRTRLTDTIRAARSDPTRAPEVRRLSMLLDGVHDAMAGAANRADIAPAPSSGASIPVAAPNVGSEVFTPSGQRVGVRYELADAGDLVTSHGADMRPNPVYPQELQPRARDRAASEVQVARIASQLQPERLGASSTVADGAPIVGPDGIVESGNGRVMALRRAYETDGPQAQAYREWLTGQGHDISGMRQPILVRRRTSDMTPEQRVAFAGEGSTPTTLAFSATERAAGDARRLPDDVLHSYQPGDVADPANRGFVRGFLRNVVEPGQEGAFVSAEGALSREGAARVRAALVHRAYGDQGVSATLAETLDPTGRVLAGAMQDAAGPMAQLRAGIEDGTVDPGVDLAPALVEATRVVQQARQKGLSLADAVAQRDAFNQVSPRAEVLLRSAYGDDLSGRMSQAGMARMLTAYARQAQEQSAAGSLFGDTLSADQLLEGVSSRYGKDASAQAATGTTDAVTMGPSYGQGGDRGRGPVVGAGREKAPEGSSSQQGRRVLEQPPQSLTPNFDQAAAERYAAARQATAERAATFKNAPGVGQVLQQGPQAGSFRTPDSAVPSIIVRVGPQGADVARAYLQAGGSPQALSDAAAFSLRREAMRPDGTLDPAKFAAWAKQRSSFLSQIPDAAARFGAAADAQRAAEAGSVASAQALKEATARAQRTVDDAVAARAAANKAIQDSAIGKLIGTADPVTQVGSILRRPSAVADMKILAQAVKGTDAEAGLQRAVAEHILRDLKGNATGASGTETYLKGDQLQTFLRTREPALRQVLTPEQMTSLRNVAASLEQSNLSVSGSKLAGGSDTVQNAAAAANAAPTTLMGFFGNELTKTLTSGAGGAIVGSQLGGVTGAAIGGVTGIMARAMQAAREAGIQNVDHLVTQAMLNPALARVLLTKVTPKNEASLTGALVSQLKRLSLVSMSQGGQGQEQRRQAPPPATLHQNSLIQTRSGPPQATPMNGLFAPSGTPPRTRHIRQPGTLVMP